MKEKLHNFLKTDLLKDSLVYGLTNALYTGLPLILLPFFVTILQPEDYGLVDLFRSFTLVLTPIVGLGAVASIDRFYFEFHQKIFQKLVSSVILMHFINGIILVAFLFFLNLLYDSKYYLIINLAILFCVFNQIVEILLVLYRVERKSTNYLLVRLGLVVLDILLLALFYFWFNTYNWTYRVGPLIISTTFIGLLAAVLLFRKYKYPLELNFTILKTVLIFSSPLIIHMIAGYVLNIGNRFFVLHFLGEKELGNFSVAYQIGMAINFFFTSFNLAWTPTFYDWMNKKKFKQIKKVEQFVLLSLPILGLIIILVWNVLNTHIQNLSQYQIPLLLIVIILVAHIFLSYYKFYSNYFFYFKKTKELSLVSLFSGLLCVLLNVTLIPSYGIKGSAYATFIAFFIMWLLVYFRSRKFKLL